jgi:hypothetical protein
MSLSVAWPWTSLLRQVSTAYFINCAKVLIVNTATSVDAERAFSRGGLTVSKLRHSLSDSSVCAATCLASWERTLTPSVLPRQQLVETIKAKSSRKGKGAVRDVSDNEDEGEAA